MGVTVASSFNDLTSFSSVFDPLVEHFESAANSFADFQKKFQKQESEMISAGVGSIAVLLSQLQLWNPTISPALPTWMASAAAEADDEEQQLLGDVLEGVSIQVGNWLNEQRDPPERRHYKCLTGCGFRVNEREFYFLRTINDLQDVLVGFLDEHASSAEERINLLKKLKHPDELKGFRDIVLKENTMRCPMPRCGGIVAGPFVQ